MAARDRRPEGLSLDMLINRLAVLGKLTQMLVIKGEDRFTGNLKGKGPRWTVWAHRDATEALWAALGPQRGESWFKHLDLPEGYDFDCEEIIAARRIFMHHDESGCVYVVEPGCNVPPPDGGDEIDEDLYDALALKYSGGEPDEDDGRHLI